MRQLRALRSWNLDVRSVLDETSIQIDRGCERERHRFSTNTRPDAIDQDFGLSPHLGMRDSENLFNISHSATGYRCRVALCGCSLPVLWLVE